MPEPSAPDPRRRTLDHAPSDRYSGPGEVRPADQVAPPDLADARDPRRGLAVAVTAAVLGAALLALVAGLLGSSTGLLFVAGVMGAAIGLALASEEARPGRR